MVDLMQQRGAAGPVDSRRTVAPSRSDRSLKTPFANSFSAALGRPADTKSNGSFSKTERVRSTPVTKPQNQPVASVTPKDTRTSPFAPFTGQNLLEIPMDQPPSVTKAVYARLSLGAQDGRDAISDSAGKLTASGAPSIVRLAAPVANQWGYTGEAAHNPYFITPSNPLRDGLVVGFSNWFESNHVGGISDVEMNVTHSATQDGGLEALRLVQQYDPGASLTAARFGGQGGPWVAEKDTREIVLSNGAHLNAGLLLGSYYNRGQGVTATSDNMLKQAVSG